MTLASWNYVPAGSSPPDLYEATDYSEALGAGEVSTSPGSPGVTRIFYVLHSVLPNFLDDLLGYSYAEVTSSSSAAIRRVLPDPHPIFANYFASEASVTPLGKLGQTNKKLAKYTVARVTCVYRAPSYQVKEDGDILNELDRFVTRRYSFGGDFITINSTGMRFVSNIGGDGTHLALNQPPARPTMTMEMTYIWEWVPPNPNTSPYIPPNLKKIKDCYGRVNSTEFDARNMKCPAGTVLFLGVDPEMVNYRITTGEATNNLYWRIALKFLYRDNGHVTRSITPPGGSSATINLDEQAGHQFLWDQQKAWWDLITNDGLPNGDRLHQTADLNLLFTLSN